MPLAPLTKKESGHWQTPCGNWEQVSWSSEWSYEIWTHLRGPEGEFLTRNLNPLGDRPSYIYHHDMRTDYGWKNHMGYIARPGHPSLLRIHNRKGDPHVECFWAKGTNMLTAEHPSHFKVDGTGKLLSAQWWKYNRLDSQMTRNDVFPEELQSWAEGILAECHEFLEEVLPSLGRGPELQLTF